MAAIARNKDRVFLLLLLFFRAGDVAHAGCNVLCDRRQLPLQVHMVRYGRVVGSGGVWGVVGCWRSLLLVAAFPAFPASRAAASTRRV